MILIWIIPIFLLGLVVGSFLNVVIERLASREAFIFGRSKCPQCRIELKAWQLVPLFSYILLRARCHNCKKPISAQYPIMELVTALLFVAVFFVFDQGVHLRELFVGALPYGSVQEPRIIPALFFFIALIHVGILLVLFVTDFKRQILPDKVLLPGLVLAAITAPFHPLLVNETGKWWYPFIAAVIAGGFFLLLYLFSKGKWIGFGDVKLGLYMGLLLGWPNILAALFIAFVVGALVGVILITTRNKKWGQRIPFGTFLTAATILTWFVGTPLIEWYLGLLGV